MRHKHLGNLRHFVIGRQTATLKRSTPHPAPWPYDDAGLGPSRISMAHIHLHEELARSKATVTAETQYGTIHGRRAANGAAVFLGTFAHSSRAVFRTSDVRRVSEVPYALPPTRFADPVPLPPDFRYEDKEYILESKCTFRFKFRSSRPPSSLNTYLIIPDAYRTPILRVSTRDADPQIADAVQPKNDGQAEGSSPGTHPRGARISCD